MNTKKKYKNKYNILKTTSLLNNQLRTNFVNRLLYCDKLQKKKQHKITSDIPEDNISDNELDLDIQVKNNYFNYKKSI
jgi:hypothetical protein